MKLLLQIIKAIYIFILYILCGALCFIIGLAISVKWDVAEKIGRILEVLGII